MDPSNLGALIVAAMGAITGIGAWFSTQSARLRRDLREARRDLAIFRARDVRWMGLDYQRRGWAAQRGYTDMPVDDELLILPGSDDDD